MAPQKCQPDYFTKSERKSKFKKALCALRVNYHLEILDWDCRKDARSSKVYFEARCLLHNIEVNLNLAWEKLKDLDIILEEFFYKCSHVKCSLVNSKETVDMSESQKTNLKVLDLKKTEEQDDDDQKFVFAKVNNIRFVLSYIEVQLSCLLVARLIY